MPGRRLRWVTKNLTHRGRHRASHGRWRVDSSAWGSADGGGSRLVSPCLGPDDKVARRLARKRQIATVDRRNRGGRSHRRTPRSGLRRAWSKEDWLAVSTGQEVRLYGPDRKLARKFAIDGSSMAWHPDGKRLLCSGWVVTVWDRDTGTEVGRSGMQRWNAWLGDLTGRCVLLEQSAFGSVASPSDLAAVQATPIGNLAVGTRSLGLPMAGSSRRICWYSGPPRLWDVNGSQLRCWTEPVASTAGWFAWRPDGGELLAGNASHVWAADDPGAAQILSIEQTLLGWVQSPGAPMADSLSLG